MTVLVLHSALHNVQCAHQLCTMSVHILMCQRHDEHPGPQARTSSLEGWLGDYNGDDYDDDDYDDDDDWDKDG